MAVFELFVQAKLNGQPLDGTPIYKRIELDESIAQLIAKADTAGFEGLVPSNIGAASQYVRALLIDALEGPVNLRFNRLAAAPYNVNLRQGGLVIVIDGELDNTTGTPGLCVEAEKNDGAGPADLRIFAGAKA